MSGRLEDLRGPQVAETLGPDSVVVLPIGAIEQHGPYRLHAPGELMTHLDELLKAFVAQHRMKLPGSHYEPCYALVG